MPGIAQAGPHLPLPILLPIDSEPNPSHLRMLVRKRHGHWHPQGSSLLPSRCPCAVA